MADQNIEKKRNTEAVSEEAETEILTSREGTEFTLAHLLSGEKMQIAEEPAAKTGGKSSSGRTGRKAAAKARLVAKVREESSEKYARELLAEERAATGELLPVLVNVSSGEISVIHKKEFTVGFSFKCDLKLRQPDPEHHTVSRLHATLLTKEDGRVYVRDESTNGTFIGTNPKKAESFFRLPKGNELEVKDGQYIKFADVLFSFRKGGLE